MILKLNSNHWSLLVIILTIIFSGFVHLTHNSWIWGIDDAMIYKTYMKNFSLFGEFIYNEGGERVEGFTSLLWTLIGSFFYKFAKYPNPLFIVFNIIVISIILIKSLGLINEKEKSIESVELKILFLSLIFLTPGFIEWNINSQLETGLWSFLLFMSFLSIEKKNIYGFLLSGILMVFTRPESYLIFPLCIILFTYNTKKKSYFFLSSLVLISTIFILFYFRYNYFGYLFPNTFYAKVSSSLINNFKDGFLYIGKTWIEFPLLSISAYISILFIKRYYVLTFFIFLPYLISILIGGDHFGYQRIFQPFIIFNHLIIIYFILDNLTVFLKHRKDNLYFLFPLVILILLVPRNGRLVQIAGNSPIAHEWKISENGFNSANYMNMLFSDLDETPSIGVITTGGIGYQYNGKTIDLLGLNNVQMAHYSSLKKGLKNHGSFSEFVFFKDPPDVLISGGQENYFGDTNVPFVINSSDYLNDIEKTEKFQELYSFVRIEYKGKNIIRFVLDDFLKKLPPQYEITRLEYVFQDNS